MYNTEIKRNILYALEKYYDYKNKRQERDNKDAKQYDLKEIIDKLLPNQDDESKKQALEECKKTMMLRNLFKSDDYRDDYYGRKLAIKLAEEYIEESKEPLPLVKEELATFYLKEGRTDKSKQLLTEILEKDPANSWVISKYAQILKNEGKIDEALEFIEERRDLIKTDLPIFNLELDILLRKKDLPAIRELCKNIPILDLDKTGEEEEFKKLFSSKKRLKGVFGEEFQDDSKQIINLINRRYKAKGRELNQYTAPSVSETQEMEISNDEKRVRKINLIISNRKQEEQKEKLKKITEEIENRIISFISKCQIASALGRKGSDIASINLSKFLKDNKGDLTEIERTTLKTLQNFLTSKQAKFYLHSEWTNFQKNNFPRLLNPGDEEKRTENKAQNEKNRNE